MQENDPAKSPAPPVPVVDPYMPPLSQPPAPAGFVSEEEKSLAMLCHLLGIFTGFLGPLILWLVKKDSSAFIGHHGREALNFQITVFLVMLCLGSVTFVLLFFLIGIFIAPLLFVVPVLALVAEIIAAVAAQKGEWFRYPCNIRLVG